MSFVISINGNLSYNFLELYNQIEMLEKSPDKMIISWRD